MISDRSRGVDHLVLICQCLLMTVGFWIWFLLCYPLPIERAAVHRYVIYNEFVLLGLLVGSRPFQQRTRLHRPSIEDIGRRSFRQLSGTLFYLLLYLVAAQDAGISRLFFFSFVPVAYLILFCTNALLPSVVGRLTFKREMVQKVLLVGPKRKALEVRDWLERNRHLGFEVMGLLSDDPEEVELGSLPLVGCPEDLERTLTGPGIMKVIVVEFPRSNGVVRRFTDLCEARGIRLLVVADIDRIFGRPVAVFEDGGMVFIGLRVEPLEDPINRFAKRAMDIVLASFVVVFILPALSLVVWLIQRIQSPGPLFYRQVRPGFHNRPFTIYKFRTLHVDNPDVNRLPTSADPRVYPAGRIFRKLSIDEIPQFLNVLFGDMSAVGPRPHLMADNDRFPRFFAKAYVRSFVKPGITGLAQVRGFRGLVETPEQIALRMESDIEYLENWSFGLDCWLVIRTALQMVFPPRAAV